MFRKSMWLIALMLLLALSACASPTPAPTVVPTAAPSTVAPTLVPTKAPPPAASALATSAPAGNAATSNFCTEVNPNQIQINTMGLPYSWQANCVAATPYNATQPPGPTGLPEHVEINFGVVNPTAAQ